MPDPQTLPASAGEDDGAKQAMQSIKPSVLLLQMGHNDLVRKAFTSILNKHGLDVETVKVAEGEKPSKSNLDEYNGIILSGSSYMVTDQHPWSVETAQRMRPVVEQGVTPVLGICYGHQLLLHTMGAEVAYMKKRQIGSRTCRLTVEAKNDPLFSVFEGRDTATVHVLHRQCVTGNVPDYVKVLATNEVDDFHACRIGERCWTVQFHPELRTKNVEFIVDAQKDMLHKDGLDYQAVRASITDSKDGALVLERFASICQEHFTKVTKGARL